MKNNQRGVILIIFISVLLVSNGLFFIKYRSLKSNIIEKTQNDARDKTKQLESEEINESENKETELDKQTDPLKHQIQLMTLEEKIGQMLIVGMDGYNMNEHTRKMIEENHIGGFIIYGNNIEDSNQLLTLINTLKQTNDSNNIPLFISIDEEGGRVSRMPQEFKKLPTNSEIGEVNNRDLSYEIGRVLAEQVKYFGFNMNFAPVLDINSNPQNPVIGNRSFGSKEKVVRELGISTMKGIQSGGIISVIKHFPGHGDTSVDSHISLPVVGSDLSRLVDFELIPFDEGIKNGADAIMVAHILLTKIDSENPSSLSKTVITSILRKQLDYEGVIITDDMTMGAIEENYTIEAAAIKSVNAGSDIILVAHGYEKEIAVLEGLKDAVEEGIISEERIDESVYRILKLKDKYDLEDNTMDSIEIESINKEITNILNKYFY